MLIHVYATCHTDWTYYVVEDECCNRIMQEYEFIKYVSTNNYIFI